MSIRTQTFTNFSFVVFWSLIAGFTCMIPGTGHAMLYFQQQVPPNTNASDTTRADTTQQAVQDSTKGPYKPSKRPTFQPSDRFGDPFSNRGSASPLYPSAPTQLDMEIDTSFNYTLHESLGDLEYRPINTMSLEEYNRYMQQKAIRDYWKNQSAGFDGESAVSGRSLIPPIYTTPAFDRIFGGSFVNIRPNGFVNLDFGGLFERVHNPSLPIRMQRNNQFHFDQQINMNVVGEIGEKLQVMANFDSNNTFDFENNFRVEYTGFEEEIIKKIEIGNVNLPVRNSLMSGAQSLFGVKTQLQFGRLFVTGVATTQRGEADMIEIEGGSQASSFSIRASDYDDNRHFFLGHFFRDHYGIEPGEWLATLPQVNSGVNITRMEVYVINRNNDTQNLRNVGAFADLAEGNPDNIILDDNQDFKYRSDLNPAGKAPTSNEANNLFRILRNNDAELRNINDFDRALESWNMTGSRDYVLMKSARKLDEREFTYHPTLGYVSLNRRLQNDEALAVSFEYTYNGKRYQVGELTENYQDRPASDVIYMKLLRPNKINTNIPTWDLMMKNIYSLNGSTQVSREGFQLRVIYRDDRTQMDNPNLQEGVKTKNEPLVRVLGLDRLNQSNDFQPDGNFDFVEGYTVNLEKGNIIFPVLEPFGDHLEKQFQDNERNLKEKYVYDTLYATTKADAELVASKNKFYLDGKYTGGSSTEISLQGINIAPGSVRVMAGNNILTEGVDYQVDYNFGQVKLLNAGVVNSGQKIRITYEKASMLNFQTRRFLGTQFDYVFNENFSIGATLLYLNELPMITRVSIGDEPTKNTKWGLDVNYRKDSRFLTRMVDALPLIQTKELSTFAFNGEFAQMLPGTSNVVQGEGTSYIDDFEQAITPNSLIGGSVHTWNMAATPKTRDDRFYGDSNGLEFGYRRARLAWYIVDHTFYNKSDRGRLVPNLNEDRMANHYVRPIQQTEIFNRDQRTYMPPEPVFDMAYFPAERGSYNYNPDLQADASLPNPEKNWGGITRAIDANVDFDANNVEYIEFWMMDPFITGPNGRNAAFEEYNINNEGSGGKLVFNLGSISEDYIKDKRHGFENGLPASESSDQGQVHETVWGRVTTRQYLNNAFDMSDEARRNQDVGMDGLRNDEEASFFSDFINRVTGPARQQVEDDPSADNWRPFISEEWDEQDANVITRYKYYNNQDGNTPIQQNNSYTPPSKSTPDNEDLNKDNTLNELEEYYEYSLDLQPSKMQIGQNHIVDQVKARAPESKEDVNWYLFRIPIRKYDSRYGDIQDFKSIRFVRTYLTGFKDPVLLRFAKMQLVGSQWRRFQENLKDEGLGLVEETDLTSFTVSAVNYEDNGRATAGDIPYVVPPGFVRDRDNTAFNQTVRINEQALQLCVDGLENRDARAVFKNVSLDMINYGRLKMLLHAQANNDMMLEDDQVTAFLRLGTDFTENYYEIEIPLKITPPGSTNEHEIWPDENEIDIALDELYQLKSVRNRQNKSMDLRFGGQAGKHTIYIKGNPDMGAVLTMMIGIRNPNNGRDKSAKSVCVWANELRVTDFDRKAGWATNARMNTKLADLANISATTRYTSVGFGSINQTVSQRTRDENLSYDIQANIALDKFLPEKSRLKLPLFVSLERHNSTPYFDPANPDLPLKSTLNSFETAEQRSNYRQIVEDRGTRRSINLTNVRLSQREEGKPNLLSLENFALTYAYSDVVQSSWQTAAYNLRTTKGAVAYNFAPDVRPIQPLSNWEALSSPYLQLLRDLNFNPAPASLSMRWDLDRRFVHTQLRNDDLSTVGIAPQFEKLFTLNRQYNMRWSLTNSLLLDYNARANAIIDEPDGFIDSDIKRDEVLNNLSHLGRMKHFDQSMGLSYRLPFDKMPFTNWLSAESRYEVNYNWTAGAIDRQGSLGQQETFGNSIQNNRSYQLNGKLDMVKLYNKVAFLKKVNDRSNQQGRPQAPQRPGQKEQPKPEAEAGTGVGVANGLMRLLMSVRSINFNYNRNQGTLLPGFQPRAFLLGFDSTFMAPGLPFMLGSQDPTIRHTAAANGWLVKSDQLTMPFTQMNGENYDLRADVQPFADIRLQVDMKKSKTANYQEIFRYDSLKGMDPNHPNPYSTLTPSRNGNYSISFLSIATAFDRKLDNNGSAAFERFVEYRGQIAERLHEVEPEDGTFSSRSQDVLVPAFLAAYSGRDPNKVKLSPFPSIPLPNWRLDYAGLSKIPALRDHFSAVTLSHSYVSRYSVNNYTNNLQYGNSNMLTLNRNIEDYNSSDNMLLDEEGRILPLYVAGQVVISEQFAPFIGINLRTKSRMNIQINYNRERNLALNLQNTQVTEQNNQDVRVDFGYTTANFKLPFRSRGREIILKNDLSFRMGVTVRDSQIIQRKFDEADDITNGSLNFQLNPTVNYLINQQLSIQLYYTTSLNEPRVLTSFRNTQTRSGIQIRYNITQ